MMRTVKDIMVREPKIIHVDLPLSEAAARMKEAGTGALFVVDGDELVGVVTDRDLVIRGMTKAADPAAATVIETMTRHVVHCAETSTIDEAAALMAEQRVRRLAVVDADCELVGVVSLGDLARAEGAGGLAAAKALRVISAPLGTAKMPAREDPTGGRARGSTAGNLHVYAQRPRIRRRPAIAAR
jgi:CBS domain-containing protein